MARADCISILVMMGVFSTTYQPLTVSPFVSRSLYFRISRLGGSLPPSEAIAASFVEWTIPGLTTGWKVNCTSPVVKLFGVDRAEQDANNADNSKMLTWDLKADLFINFLLLYSQNHHDNEICLKTESNVRASFSTISSACVELMLNGGARRT